MRFQKIKNDILGRNYSLSIAFVPKNKSREINKKYRKKDKATNVLSFALRKDEGELVLCLPVIKKEVKDGKTEKNFGEYLKFLVIHGMLHLKGMEHGSIMEQKESFYFQKYDKKHNSRNRRGVGDDKDRRGRVSKRRKKS